MENNDRKNTNLDYVNKMYNYIKNNMPIELFMSKLKCNYNELKGILALTITAFICGLLLYLVLMLTGGIK